MKMPKGKFCSYLLNVFLFLMISHSLSAATMVDWDALEVRNRINQKIMAAEGQILDVKNVEEYLIANDARSTTVRIYTPLDKEKSKTPVILLIHGGAWIAGNLETHENMSRYFCHHTGAFVVSVGYQNAPEMKFPYQLEQSFDVLNWISENAEKYNFDMDKLAILGDSAGGNMAAAMCLLTRDRGGPRIHFQVLINPAPNLTEESTVLLKKDNGTERWFVQQYVEDLKEVINPYVSPIMAETLSGVPPALVILAELDDLFEDGMMYAKKLTAFGVETEIFIQKGIGHLAGDAARATKKASESLETIVEAIIKFIAI